MKKISIVCHDIELNNNLELLLSSFGNITNFSQFVILSIRPSKNSAKIVFVEKYQDFIQEYAKIILQYRKEDVQIFCFSREENVWKQSISPVIISTLVETRLRDKK